jgi:3-methylcrotonyl-CoA carboxylase alpha subunit
MEMNTRLQVEHPVTEAVTGVDLVEWQLRVASGEALWVAQDDLSITGHSFEARLYAEDAEAGFLPATGTLHHLRWPEGTRIETGVRQGDTISPHYDPMIAKLVTHGPTRAAALAGLERALAKTQVAGAVTNLAFLRRLAQHQGFNRGEVDTGLIDREVETLAPHPVACSKTRALAACLALGLDKQQAHQGFALWGEQRWPFALTHRGEEVTGHVTVSAPGKFRVDLGELSLRVERDPWRVDGTPVPIDWFAQPGALTLFWGNAYPFTLPDPLARGTAIADTNGVLEAPMPGLVRDVLVEPGEAVAAGQRLAILEAMKMEHALRANRDGAVAEVLVEAGAQVEAGAALIRLTE